MLPIHPQPREDEIFSSWLLRIAISNGFYLHEFIKRQLKVNGEVMTRDVDKAPFPSLVRQLAVQSGHLEDDIRAMHLSAFTGELSESVNVKGKSPWVLPLGLYHRTRKRAYCVYCPICLRNDPVKYFRKKWRLAFVGLCDIHHCMLRDTCWHCQTNIDYLRLGIGVRDFVLPQQEIDVCYHCHRALSQAEPEYLPQNTLILALPYIDFLVRFSNYGNVLPTLGQPLNLQVFNGLRALVMALMSRRGYGVRKRIFDETGIDMLNWKENTDFEHMSLHHRLHLMIVVVHLIQDWLKRFLKLVADTQLSLSAFSDIATKLPYWLHTLVSSSLSKKEYQLNSEEILNARTYLISQNMIPTKIAIAKLLKVNVELISRLLP